jgi:exopolyphosphatase / guanosine-5'-triphosphate,3'-diphosphate pyrophosphatase
MYSIIDLGSNTVRLSIFHLQDQSLIPYSTHKETVGLASYVDNEKRLTIEGIEKAAEIITEFQRISKKARVKEMFVIATASLRNVVNGEEVRKILESQTGAKITQLSGEEEAMCDFYGVQLARKFDDGFVIDIGGASTEIVEYDQGVILHAFALPIGSLSAFVNHVQRILPTEKELDVIRDEVEALLNAKNVVFKPHQVIYGVGGTIRATKKLNKNFTARPESEQPLRRADLKVIIKTLLSTNKDAHLDLIRIIPERVHTILPGMTILNTVSKYLGVDQIVVENFGVREGFLYRKLILERPNPIPTLGE